MLLSSTSQLFYAPLAASQRHLEAPSTHLQKYYNKDNSIMSKLQRLPEPDGNICNQPSERIALHFGKTKWIWSFCSMRPGWHTRVFSEAPEPILPELIKSGWRRNSSITDYKRFCHLSFLIVAGNMKALNFPYSCLSPFICVLVPDELASG